MIHMNQETENVFRAMDEVEKDVVNRILKTVGLTQKLYPAIAHSYKMFVEVLMNQGFTREEAVKIAARHSPGGK